MAFLALPAHGRDAFNVVGWYVGTNETEFPLESIQWDVYSTIRCGYVAVDPVSWEASCSWRRSSLDLTKTGRRDQPGRWP